MTHAPRPRPTSRRRAEDGQQSAVIVTRCGVYHGDAPKPRRSRGFAASCYLTEWSAVLELRRDQSVARVVDPADEPENCGKRIKEGLHS
jgi:hypothetical protein